MLHTRAGKNHDFFLKSDDFFLFIQVELEI